MKAFPQADTKGWSHFQKMQADNKERHRGHRGHRGRRAPLLAVHTPYDPYAYSGQNAAKLRSAR